MADGSVPPGAADGDDHAAGRITDLTLAGGLPFESAVHPAGSGRSRWAQQELGELLGPSWLDDAPVPAEASATPVEPPASGAIWEVERMPSEAEGGVVGLLLSGRRDDSEPVPPERPAAAADPAWTDAAGSGMARLTEMLDHLPIGAVARLTPDDVEVATTAPAPPGVWFWGDDDIYPGKVPGVVETRVAPKRRVRRFA